MYSRRTYDGQFRIPKQYGGTAFRTDFKANEKRDAVGRPSAIPEKAPEKDYSENPLPQRKKVLPPLLPKQTEEMEDTDADVTAATQEKPENRPVDDVIISALILSLIGGRGERSEDITLIILALLLIL